MVMMTSVGRLWLAMLLAVLLAIQLSHGTTNDDADDDGFIHSRPRRGGGSKHKNKYCSLGCSLVNLTSGEEQESRDCPKRSTCERGPYNTTIDGDDFQVYYCHSDQFSSIFEHVETYFDRHFIKMAKTSCSATNGTLSWDRDCCDDQTCSSVTFQYDYLGTTFDFTFCEEDGKDTTLLRAMGCRQYCK